MALTKLEETIVIKTEGVKEATAGLNKMDDALDNVAENAADASGGVDKFGKSAKGVISANDSLKASVQGSSEAIHRMGDNASKAAISTAKLGDNTKKAQGKLNSFGNKVLTISTATIAMDAAMRAAAAGARILAKPVDISTSFEKQFALIRTLSKDVSPNLKSDLQQLAREVPQSLASVGEAAYNAISAGIDPTQVVDFLRSASNAATGSASSLADTVTVLTAGINAFGKQGETAATVADKLQATIREAVLNGQQLNAVFGNVTPAADYGIALSDAMGAVARLTKLGRKPEIAVTQLNAAMRLLGSENEEVKKRFKEVGVETGMYALQSKGLIGVLKEIQTATGGSAEALGKLATESNAQKAILGLMSDFEALNEAVEKIESSAGASADAAAMVGDTGAGSMDKFNSAVENLQLKLGEEVMPVLIELLENFSVWIEENGEELAGDFKDGIEGIVSFGKWVVANGDTITSILQGMFAAGALNKFHSGIMGLQSALAGGTFGKGIVGGILNVLGRASVIGMVVAAAVPIVDAIIDYFVETTDEVMEEQRRKMEERQKEVQRAADDAAKESGHADSAAQSDFANQLKAGHMVRLSGSGDFDPLNPEASEWVTIGEAKSRLNDADALIEAIENTSNSYNAALSAGREEWNRAVMNATRIAARNAPNVSKAVVDELASRGVEGDFAEGPDRTQFGRIRGSNRELFGALLAVEEAGEKLIALEDMMGVKTGASHEMHGRVGVGLLGFGHAANVGILGQNATAQLDSTSFKGLQDSGADPMNVLIDPAKVQQLSTITGPLPAMKKELFPKEVELLRKESGEKKVQKDQAEIQRQADAHEREQEKIDREEASKNARLAKRRRAAAKARRRARESEEEAIRGRLEAFEISKIESQDEMELAQMRMRHAKETRKATKARAGNLEDLKKLHEEELARLEAEQAARKDEEMLSAKRALDQRVFETTPIREDERALAVFNRASEAELQAFRDQGLSIIELEQNIAKERENIRARMVANIAAEEHRMAANTAQSIESILGSVKTIAQAAGASTEVTGAIEAAMILSRGVWHGFEGASQLAMAASAMAGAGPFLPPNPAKAAAHKMAAAVNFAQAAAAGVQAGATLMTASGGSVSAGGGGLSAPGSSLPNASTGQVRADLADRSERPAVSFGDIVLADMPALLSRDGQRAMGQAIAGEVARELGRRSNIRGSARIPERAMRR